MRWDRKKLTHGCKSKKKKSVDYNQKWDMCDQLPDRCSYDMWILDENIRPMGLLINLISTYLQKVLNKNQNFNKERCIL